MGLTVEALPRLAARPGNVSMMDDGEGIGLLQGLPPNGRGKWRSVSIGAPRGSSLCEFALSARPLSLKRQPGPPSLKVGFVQTLLSTRRIATYTPSLGGQGGAVLFGVTRNSTLVGNGLLDCGDSAPPWFQGRTVSFTMPFSGTAAPQVVNAFDNPRWSIPLLLTVPKRGTGWLAKIELSDHFRLYAVVSDGKHYTAAACTEWGTDLTFIPHPGQALPLGVAPRGAINGRKVWADMGWSSNITIQPIVAGRRANQILVDTLIL